MTKHRFIEPAIVVLALAMVLVCGCRTSQQARRPDSRTNRTSTNRDASQTDSILMVQQHLLDLIDTMADALSHDRTRIRALELEVARLRSELERTRYAVSMADGSRYAIPPPSAAIPPATVPGQVVRPPGGEQTEPAQSPQGRTYTGPPPTEKETPKGSAASQDFETSAKEHYAEALQLFNQARYDEALLAFRLLETNDPTGPMASNYVYWQGECLYGLERDNEALQIFASVVDRFPASSKADAAQFKIGECYEKLGSPPSARLAYQKLLQNYPDTSFRSRAEARMRRLR